MRRMFIIFYWVSLVYCCILSLETFHDTSLTEDTLPSQVDLDTTVRANNETLCPHPLDLQF